MPRRRRWPLVLIIVLIVFGGLVGRSLVLRRGHSRAHDRRLEGARSEGRPRLHLREPDDRRISLRHRAPLRRCRRRFHVEPAAGRAQGRGHADLGAGLAADRADHGIRRPADHRRAGAGPRPSRRTGSARRRRCTACRLRRKASPSMSISRLVDARRRYPDLFKAERFDLDGRLISGTVQDHPVIEAVLKLVAATAPYWHPAAATPIDADITAVLRGLKDFAPKPWPRALPRIAGGRRPHRDHQGARAAARHHCDRRAARSDCRRRAGSTASFASPSPTWRNCCRRLASTGCCRRSRPRRKLNKRLQRARPHHAGARQCGAAERRADDRRRHQP